MPETWLSIVNSYIYYAHQSHEIYQVLPYSVDFKAPKEFELNWMGLYLVNVVLYRLRDLQTFEILSTYWIQSLCKHTIQ